MLINNIAELREQIPASVTLDFNDIKPKIRLVEREVIQRIFSSELYDAVIASGASGDFLKLREILAEAVAHLALVQYLPFGQVQFDSGGIRIVTNENMKTAFEWQIDKLEDECTKQGWSAVEAALEFIENSEITQLRDIWEETDTYKLAQDSLISNLRTFEKFVNLNHSRILFNKLLPVLSDQQEEVIKEAIGKPLFLKITKDLNPASDLLIKTRKLASKALAFKTMAVGFMDTLLILTDNGPLVIDGMVSRQPKAKRSAPTDVVLIIAENYKTRAAGALRELVEFCQTNADELVEFKESGNYIGDPEAEQNHIPRPDPDWGVAFF
ncbi:DUF6712 family protein [Mongoliibacter ruber]|uniref:Uncharacterized protein n=1 Tax=Mongoliibacter ruber TaxID=1750599 RepID=A0A2T0WVG5_9BACT|nr:DUF6712 family protein [Mongoliibacter ruber]PRY90574.1 hypothetical protein CLW00_101237 [Mongoliibacter ruber]